MTDNVTNQGNKQTKYWRSLAEEAESPEFLEKIKNEFPQGLVEINNVAPVDRRRFLGVIGSSLAFAGVTSLSGCIRKPRELVLPYNQRPEDLVPGRPQNYATSAYVAGTVLGLVVESHEGRPTKIEGNPLHPMSFGATSAWGQAVILDLYDPDRSRLPSNAGAPSSIEAFNKFAAEFVTAQKASRGSGLAFLLESTPSPVLRGQLRELQKNYPDARFYLHDAASSAEKNEALRLVGQPKTSVVYGFDKAEVVLSVDSDFLNVEGDSVRNARLTADKRRMPTETSTMNRIYAVSSVLTSTSMSADHRLRLQSSKMGEFLLALINALASRGLSFSSEILSQARKDNSVSTNHQKWVASVAADLANNRGKSVVVAGEMQPAIVQALAFAVNQALGNVNVTVNFFADSTALDTGSLADLAKSLAAGEVKSLVMVGGNPAYDAPADLGFADLIKNVPVSIHLSQYVDETSQKATWHVARSHFLESWGDLRASDGTTSIQQPLIAPLYQTVSDLEFVALLASGAPANAYELVRAYWRTQGAARGDFEKAWRRWLHDGVLAELQETPSRNELSMTELGRALASYVPVPEAGLEIVFPLDSCVFDGRFGNNGWMQEIPDPVSKITWDNAALMTPATARSLNASTGDMIELTLEGRKIEIGVFEVPGVANNTIVVARGYGRTFGGHVASGAGVNANLIRTSTGAYFAMGGAAKKTGKTYEFATTQEHNSLEGRNIVREATADEYRKDPTFVEKVELMKKDMQRSLLWEEPNSTTGVQWGMSIDLNVCNSCNACTVACVAENNIPVVGKDQVRRGREMHWLRLDRYFTGSVDDPQALFQPMMCQHCENAPCEGVCPVAATVHSPDGINEMTYNRCVGTRYCSNNCPYKVRRFNFFNYTKTNEEAAPLAGMQKNPDVTVRFRGVMEKCTYCVQRVNEAKIEAKLKNQTTVADGRVVTACQQVCPTKAIVFGNINDPESEVVRAKKQKRDYTVLGELNTQTRTSYLAKLRNPNPELV